MSMEQILEEVRSLEGVLVLAPAAGSSAPEIAWGDYFFYYAPDGEVPANMQPFATIVTKNYPGDTQSDLDPDGRWRVNINVGRARLAELTTGGDFAEADVMRPHPVYAAAGWLAVVVPADRTSATVADLLRSAYDTQRRRVVGRSGDR
ncbi:DUF6194 family protein [Antrihabitans sp. YC2-6]|uniref:DUF6194 family protein n=1 Tax=Antrihabitans sp. YC2-6 TaxID=2799498 RepID=UPI0018F65655|nr:DUF6194 family protein [Antrihabitans sp. YC2-6]MBJ8343088.1 hypothetical protein [Antrihabitans sp. YC2-6]